MSVINTGSLLENKNLSIFEITENTDDTLKLMDLVSNAYIPDLKNKMGLDLEKLYERQTHVQALVPHGTAIVTDTTHTVSPCSF